jgi:single-stranded DNA-binding protein
MSALVLISGTLFRAPEQKTSKSGKPYVTATIRAKDGDGSQFWRVVSFSDSAGAELLRLSDGDGVSVQGSLKIEPYEREGVTKIGLTIIPDHVLALRQPPKERKPRAAAPEPARSEKPASDRSALNRHGDGGVDHFGDDLPF